MKICIPFYLVALDVGELRNPECTYPKCAPRPPLEDAALVWRRRARTGRPAGPALLSAQVLRRDARDRRSRAEHRIVGPGGRLCFALQLKVIFD